MKKNKYKILVLSDLKKSTGMTLKSTISLAKIIGANIDFFYVKKPTDIIERESQLSAMRTINSEFKATDKKIKKIIDPFSKDYDIQINSQFAFGNVKHEIDKYLLENKPDIVVLGKRKSKSFSFVGDNMIDFILEKHHGVVMIAANDNTFNPNDEISLGVLNGIKQSLNVDFSEDLLGHSQKPLRSFKIVNNSKSLNEIETINSKNTVEYVFEQNDYTFKNLSNYLEKNNINLLCVDRGTNKGKANQKKAEIKNIINNLNVSLLLS